MSFSSQPLLGTLAEACGALLRPKTDLQRAIALVVRIKLFVLMALSCALHLAPAKPASASDQMARHFFHQAMGSSPTPDTRA
ncbi:hypothetical protein [Novosphingobium sp. KACC 22771]|uniref:hypothetical protein n=1 Tax=Novosphingobium sp. KACC 22771 TaxID=3025670 RepID=UPI002365EC2F|nr:hypothetical protein [Novosphingobium sp. KACC 22771]WDF70939.1 hypothetical protein PQ467_08750 [Novosphingobium sp. KACC 22771]